MLSASSIIDMGDVWASYENLLCCAVINKRAMYELMIINVSVDRDNIRVTWVCYWKN